MTIKPIVPPDSRPMSALVGEGIALFAVVEFDLGLLFARLLKPEQEALALIAIHSVRAFEAKLKIVDTVAAAALTGKDLADWKTISSHIRKRKDYRNKIAHWTVTPVVRSFAGNPGKDEVLLTPPLWSAGYNQSIKNAAENQEMRPLREADLRAANDRLAKLHTELSGFVERFRNPKNRTNDS